MLVGYTFHATFEMEHWANAADGSWWAKAYVMQDRTISDRYLRRCAPAGTGAIALTVNIPGALADASFRHAPLSGRVAVRGIRLQGGQCPDPHRHRDEPRAR
jgi:hypothetical protein